MAELSSKKIGDFLTTGQVAFYCGVNFRTVIRWIKKGYLNAQRLPGRGDHRVSRKDFIEFLKRNSLVVPGELESSALPLSPRALQASSEGEKRVLVVDDDRTTAKSIQRVLMLKGYETKVAHDGFEAGRLMEGFDPALMTLDLMMPGMDGLVVLEHLRAEGRLSSLKVIVISGDSDTKIERALELGASFALKKPFGNQELISSVATLIGPSGKKDVPEKLPERI